MREVTTGTTLGLYRQMLENEWTLLLAMTLVTNLVLIGGSPQLGSAGSTLRVMAISAFYQSLIHSMAEGAIELGLNLGVALIAQYRLFLDQERLLLPGFVRRVATDTADISAGVFRTKEITLLVL